MMLCTPLLLAVRSGVATLTLAAAHTAWCLATPLGLPEYEQGRTKMVSRVFLIIRPVQTRALVMGELTVT